MTIMLDQPVMTKEMIDAAVDSLQNEYSLFGESITKFEEEFASYCGTDHAVSLGSGSDALMLSLIALGVEGKHVLTTPMSYVATANTSFHAGGEPVFADIQENGNIDPKEISKSLKKDKKIKTHSTVKKRKNFEIIKKFILTYPKLLILLFSIHPKTLTFYFLDYHPTQYQPLRLHLNPPKTNHDHHLTLR